MDDAAQKAACTRSLSAFAPHRRTPSRAIQRWASADTEAAIDGDVFGEGGLVAEVEQDVAALLGKPAAVFMPTGTMAQQIALRVHADARGSRTVVFHPLCHLECNEERAFEHLHGLVGRPAGAPDRLLTLADLQQVDEPCSALVLELPQRMIGAQLPSWADLVAQCAWARDRGAAVHMDGARLWETQPYYGRPYAEIAALFDTVYVSFYKGLGGLGGCALAGPVDVIDAARIWRIRHGGVVFALWPYAADARHGLAVEAPQMAPRYEQARTLAAELAGLPGFGVRPDPPQTPLFGLLIDQPAAAVQAARARVAGSRGVWMFDRLWPGPPTRVEVTVGDQLVEFAPGEVAELFALLRSFAAEAA